MPSSLLNSSRGIFSPEPQPNKDVNRVYDLFHIFHGVDDDIETGLFMSRDFRVVGLQVQSFRGESYIPYITHYSSLHLLFHYPNITQLCSLHFVFHDPSNTHYGSFHFLFHYPYMAPYTTPKLATHVNMRSQPLVAFHPLEVQNLMLGLYNGSSRDHGTKNGNYYNGLYRVYMGFRDQWVLGVMVVSLLLKGVNSSLRISIHFCLQHCTKIQTICKMKPRNPKS